VGQARPKDPPTNGRSPTVASPGETRAQIRIPARVGERLTCIVTAHNVIAPTTLRSSNHINIHQFQGQIL